MERIDRILIRAKKAAQVKAERFIMGFVTYDPGKGQYKACGHLWNGRKGAGLTYAVGMLEGGERLGERIYIQMLKLWVGKGIAYGYRLHSPSGSRCGAGKHLGGYLWPQGTSGPYSPS